MKRILLVCAAAAAGMYFFLSGCASAKTAAPMQTPAGDWQLVRLTYEGASRPISAATLSISEEKDMPGKYAASGFSGVNSYSGSFIVTGTAVKPSDAFASTRMAGPPEAMEFESLYLAILVSADKWEITEAAGTGRLILACSADGSALEFSRIRLAGTTWQLVSRNTGNAVVSVSGNGGNIPSLSFGFDGEVSGNTGVNVLRTTYVSDAGEHSLSIMPGAVSLAVSGSEEANELERQYLELLGRVSSYSISGGTLSLLDSDGRILLVFRDQDTLMHL